MRRVRCRERRPTCAVLLGGTLYTIPFVPPRQPMAAQQCLQVDTQRPPDLEIDEQVLLHLRYASLITKKDEFSSLVAKAYSELDISVPLSENIHARLERLQSRCSLPPNGWHDSKVDLMRGARRYHELCKATARLSAQQEQIERAVAKADNLSADDWSRYARLFTRSCNPSEFYPGSPDYLDTPQSRDRLDNLHKYRVEYKHIKAAELAERGSGYSSNEAQHASAAGTLSLDAWVCVPKHLHEDATFKGQARRHVGIIINVVGGGMVGIELPSPRATRLDSCRPQGTQWIHAGRRLPLFSLQNDTTFST